MICMDESQTYFVMQEIEQRVASMNLDEIERLAMKRMAIARGEQ